MKKSILTIATLFLIGLMHGATTAHAGAISYTEQVTATGNLNEVDFTNALVTITGIGDTANVTQSGSIFSNTLTSATVTVAGIGTDALTSPLSIIDYQSGTVFSPYVAIMNGSIATSVGTFSPAFSTYTLTNTIGPVTGPIFMGTFGSNTAGGGGFSITATAATSTFRAPEPLSSTLLLLGLGALGLRTRMPRRGR